MSFACGDKLKPEIKIEVKSLNFSTKYCTDFEIIIPKNYTDTVFIGQLTLSHGENLNELAFPLQTLDNGREDNSLSTYICAKPQWFNEAIISIGYKKPPDGSGWVLACHDIYEYKNLSQIVTKSSCAAEGCCKDRACLTKVRKLNQEK